MSTTQIAEHQKEEKAGKVWNGFQILGFVVSVMGFVLPLAQRFGVWGANHALVQASVSIVLLFYIFWSLARIVMVSARVIGKLLDRRNLSQPSRQPDVVLG